MKSVFVLTILITVVVEDFILNECFCQWVIQPDAASDLFWQKWQAKYPHTQATIERARSIILRIKQQIDDDEDKDESLKVSQSEKETVWQHIITKIK